MGPSSRFIGALLCLFVVEEVKTVDGQTKVQGFIGEDVLLSCTYGNVDRLENNTSVYWMDKDDSILLKMTKTGTDYSAQSPKYKGRVDAFPKLLKTGNFSVLLKNCQPSDSGPYECNIPAMDFNKMLRLNISGQRVAATRAPPGSGGAVATPSALCRLLCLLSVPLWGRV